MGKHTLCIEYLHNRKVYAPGDIVEGVVAIELKKPRKIKKIKVIALGESKVKLSHSRKQLREQEKYFQYEIEVFRGPDADIAVGSHKYAFRFQLPNSLPTSYEGVLGYVRYTIQAVVEYPGILSSKMKYLSAFTVLDTVDLNALPTARQAQRITCEKPSSGMCCWRKLAITVNLTTMKSGFVPGEFIKVNGIISNGRDKPIKVVKVNLQQQVTFYGRLKSSPPNTPLISHMVTNTVATWNMENKSIVGQTTENWENKQLMQIPPLISTGLRHCKLIDVQYYLRVTVVVPGSVTNSEITGRSNFLTIGTVPLIAPRSPVVQQPQSSLTPQLPVAPPPVFSSVNPSAPPPSVFSPDPSAPPPPYDPGNFPSVPLPSYEEAVTGGASIGQDQEEREENDEIVSPDARFTPQYTFYDFSQPAFNPAFAPVAEGTG